MMKNSSYQLLVNAAGNLMQQHAFDHLSDEKLGKMHSYIQQLSQLTGAQNRLVLETEFLNLCSEANLYVETATTQSLHEWYTAMQSVGRLPIHQFHLDEEGASF